MDEVIIVPTQGRGRGKGMMKRGPEHLTLEKMQEAAARLGGECLSTEYKSLRTKMRWRCAQGHEWEAQGQNVRRGKWCLRCSGKMRRTLQEMQVLAVSRGGLCLSPAFKNRSTKLLWQCRRRHQWEARPHLVKVGQRCPQCANEKPTAEAAWQYRRSEELASLDLHASNLSRH